MHKRFPAVFLLLLPFLFLPAQAQQNLYKEAAEKMSQGNIPAAISILDTIIAQNPKDSNAYKFRSDLRSMKGDRTGALEDMNKLIELKPDTAQNYLDRGLLKMTIQQFEGAKEDFDTALEKGAPGDKVFLKRALLKSLLKDKEGALKDYQMAINIRPHSAAANNGYALLLDEKGESQAAIDHLEEFIARIEKDWDNEFPKTKVKPINDTILPEPQPLVVGQPFFAGGQSVIVTSSNPKTREEAEIETAQTEQLLNLAVTYSNLASLYEKKNDLTKAVININKAFSLVQGSQSYSFFDTRGKIRLKMKDYNNAIKDFSVAIQMMPFIFSSYLDRGIAYFMLGKDNEAQKDFDSYLTKFPKGKEKLDQRLEEARQQKTVK